MAGRKRLYLIVVVLVFSGCASYSHIPFTHSIINEIQKIEGMDGLDGTKEFQYYISKKITLHRVIEGNVPDMKGGRLLRETKKNRDEIIFPENLHGVVRRPEETGEYKFYVAFEKYEGDPVIAFGQYKRGENEKYYILYDDEKKHTIKYGKDQDNNDKYYVVTYEGNDLPYLLIKMTHSVKDTSKSRTARGLKVGQ